MLRQEKDWSISEQAFSEVVDGMEERRESEGTPMPGSPMPGAGGAPGQSGPQGPTGAPQSAPQSAPPADTGG